MAITVEQYHPDLKRSWDHFVSKSNNGTMFHSHRFLGYHPQGRFEDHSLIFKEGNAIQAVLPATLQIRDGGRLLSSHGGASYGGFVYHESLSIQTAFDLIAAAESYVRGQNIQAMALTLPPVIYHERPSNYMEFALYKAGFGYRKREISSVIPLDYPVRGILDHFKPEARTAYRKSEKMGLRIIENDDFETFYPVLENNLSLRHQVKPTHTLDELLALKKLFPDQIRFFGAYAGESLAAGVVNFICNPRVVLAFYISHDSRFQEYRPVNGLFFHIIRWCIENGYRFLDFGIFTVNEEPNWGLGKFKESFGARGIFRDTFYKQY